MVADDTSIGEGGRSFPATSWGLVVRMQDSATMTRRQALESLCERYRKPVYVFARKAWSKSREDADDLTQAFFLRLQQGEPLRNYKPEKGGFRTFLKVLLRRFEADQHDARQALKRGGGAKRLSIEDEDQPLKELIADPKATNPEEAFDCVWKEEVLKRAIERARREFEAEGRDYEFRVFDAFEFDDGPDRPTYAQVAEQLKVSESDVRNHLFAVREKLRSEIRAELSQTVSSMEELEEEWNSLFGD